MTEPLPPPPPFDRPGTNRVTNRVTSPVTSPAAAPGTAQILERGYRRYDGPRLGLVAAMRAVWWFSTQRMLGMRRPIWAKLLPAGVVFISYVPAIVFVGVVALAKNDPQVATSLPTYADYYNYVMLAVVLFAAFSAPDVLCPDRRTGMLGLYLASPLNRDTYLVAKAASILSGLLLVTAGPQLLFLIANIMQGATVGGAGTTALMALRIIGAGLAVAALFTSVTMAISSFTDRRGFASAAIVLGFFASGAIGSSLADSRPGLALIGLAVQLPEALTTRTFGVTSRGPSTGVATAEVWIVGIGVIVVASLITRFRYARLAVTR